MRSPSIGGKKDSLSISDVVHGSLEERMGDVSSSHDMNFIEMHALNRLGEGKMAPHIPLIVALMLDAERG